MEGGLEPDTLADQLAAFDRRLRALETAPRARDTTVDEPGSFRLRNALGVTMAYFGRLAAPVTAFGSVLLRSGGQTAIAVFNDGVQPTDTVAIYDSSGGQVFATDEASGEGLARPYLSSGLASLDSATYSGTTSTTFTPLEGGYLHRTHPRLRWRGLIRTDLATTGEYRLLVGGVQVGSTIVAGADAFQYANIEGTWPGSHYSQALVELQARTTSGVGFVRAITSSVVGVQS